MMLMEFFGHNLCNIPEKSIITNSMVKENKKDRTISLRDSIKMVKKCMEPCHGEMGHLNQSIRGHSMPMEHLMAKVIIF